MDGNLLRDKFKENPVVESTVSAAMDSKVKTLINKAGRKLTFFNNVALKVE